MSTRISRRKFLSKSAGVALAASTFPCPAFRRVSASPNERVSLGVIGLRGRGKGHVNHLLGLPKEARLACLCDVDANILGSRREAAREKVAEAPQGYGDFRRVIDDKSVDAVVIATPNHWHVPIALPAVEAGKDCYVEKPMSHVFQEGRLLVDAAEKHGRIIQHGTQTRSSPVFAEAAEVLASGVIGEIRMAKAWNLQRLSVLTPKPATDPPEGVDYDRWLGPAPKRPFRPNRFHKTWFQFRDYGNGDIGDDAPHELDVARWGLGVTTHPVRITAHGSRTFLGGEREFPDNMFVAYQFADERVLLYEERAWTPYGEYGFDNANAFYGTKGRMVFSRRGHYQVYLGKKDEKGPSFTKATARGQDHMQDFLASIRTRKPPRAPALEGHLTCALVHLGLIAADLERTLHFDAQSEKFRNDSAADARLTKTYREPWGLS